MGDRIVRSKEGRIKFGGISASYWWKLVSTPEFPPRIRLGGVSGRVVGWSERALDEWLQQQQESVRLESPE